MENAGTYIVTIAVGIIAKKVNMAVGLRYLFTGKSAICPPRYSKAATGGVIKPIAWTTDTIAAM